ncbi:uncharacterized protein LOC133889746 [Phragmites australis]|uniref:uncharacterized protein LOC133889746 n=1 Tax=Phragmites australis TaxID=29695 RepID=UPI002D76F95F|nr:uncharacterized protein LOC133889746 [Phragmites australis]
MEVDAWGKSDHKGEGEGEASKRRNIDSDAEVAVWDRELMWLQMDLEELCTETKAVRKKVLVGEEVGKSVNSDAELTKRTEPEIMMKREAAREIHFEVEGTGKSVKIEADAEWNSGKGEVMRKREGARKRGSKGKGKGKAVNMYYAEKLQRELEKYEEYKKRMEEEFDPNSEEVTDPYAFEARSFEKWWNDVYARTGYGRFEDNTSIPCKRFTFDPAPCGAIKCETLQVFSVKVAELTGGLQWPLDVFGMVALRDTMDFNRNIIFECGRDNCQTLTDENPYLVLTGPVRGVLLCDYVVFEVSLYVRGTSKSDDKELNLLAIKVRSDSCPSASLLIMQSYTSRLSTLGFKLGHIISSVEATISVKVISGPPDGFHGKFFASTDSIEHEILLHNSGDEELHQTGDEISLSRSVVSVESHRKLTVSVRASDGYVTSTGTKDFEPQEKGTSSKEIDIAGLCLLEVTVAWSLIYHS